MVTERLAMEDERVKEGSKSEEKGEWLKERDKGMLRVSAEQPYIPT